MVTFHSGFLCLLCTNSPVCRKAPDFAKLHERQFGQMESLDSYLAKKKQRNEAAQEQLQKVGLPNPF